MENLEFKQKLNDYQDIINKALKNYTFDKNEPEMLFRESMQYSLLAGGKRLRPILLIATYLLFKDDYQECIPFACALEMIHNFSLIHDDLPAIDNDDFRHAKPTNHKVYGESTAILAGDGLLNYAYVVMSEEVLKDNNNAINKIKLINELSKATDRMIVGEYVDTYYENKDISIELLEYMHTNKTGALIEYSVRAGAILANASKEDINNLTEYAKNIGLAFQIKDDILSEIGDEKVLGKPVGNDKLNNKSTYVTKYGVEKAQEILENITEDAIRRLDKYGDKAKFLKELAVYIKDRQK